MIADFLKSLNLLKSCLLILARKASFNSTWLENLENVLLHYNVILSELRNNAYTCRLRFISNIIEVHCVMFVVEDEADVFRRLCSVARCKKSSVGEQITRLHRNSVLALLSIARIHVHTCTSFHHWSSNQWWRGYRVTTALSLKVFPYD